MKKEVELGHDTEYSIVTTNAWPSLIVLRFGVTLLVEFGLYKSNINNKGQIEI